MFAVSIQVFPALLMARMTMMKTSRRKMMMRRKMRRKKMRRKKMRRKKMRRKRRMKAPPRYQPDKVWSLHPISSDENHC